ncbi:Myotubularin- protein 2 [Balamuthia mandrillaris]
MSRAAGSAPDSPSSSIIKKAEWIHCMRLFRDKYKEVTRNRFENDSTHVTQLKVVLLSSAECVLTEVIRKTRSESSQRYSLEELLVLNKHLGKAVEALNAAPKKAKYNSGSLTSRSTSKFHPKSDRSLRSIFTPSSKDYPAPVSSSLASDASSSLSSSITLSLEASSSFLSSSFSSSSSSSSSLLNDDQLSDSSSSSSSKEETRRRNKKYESREEENETTEEESEGGLLTARQVYSSPFALTSAESKLCQAREEMEMYLNLLESRIGLLQRILNSSDSLTVVMTNSQKWYIVGKYLHKIRVSGLLEQAPNTILALENTTELPLPHGISLLQGEKVLCEQPGVRTRTLTPFSMRPILAGCTLFITNWRVIFYFDEPHIEYSYFPVHCIQSMDKHGGRNHGGSGLEDYRIDLYLKDLRIFRLCFDKDTAVYEGGLPPRRMVFTTLLRCLQTPITRFFAFRYRPIHSVELSPRYLSSSSPALSSSRLSSISQLQEDGWNIYNPWAEYRRLGVGVDEEEIGGGSSKWKITAINQDYSLCSSYPAVFVVPDGISHSALFAVAKFRSRGRIPILSWKHPATQASIVRCSQPKTGVSRNSCPEDQNLLQAILKATPNATRLHILDARPKANAMANTAMGAGYELAGDYANCSLSFLGIANIHVMRDSLRRVRDLAETYGGTAAGYDVGLSMMNSRDDLSLLSSDETSSTSSVSTFRTHSSKHQQQDQEDGNMKKNTSSRFLRMVNSSSDGNGNNNKSKRTTKQKNSNKDSTLDSSSFPSSSASSDNNSDNNADKWFSALDATQWLHHVKLLLQSAVRAALLVHRLGEPVVVHCSDGWDRTSQLVSLAQLLLDPYYRTIVGFEVLVEKEWLRAGHQFALRLGHDGHFAHKTSKKKTGGRGKRGEKKQKEQQHNNLAKQRSPIFLQFLDCVWQLMGQFPLAFEFNENFLVELMDGMFGCKYGTFLFNTEQERKEVDLANNTESLWTYLNTHLDSLNLRNYFYEANKNFSPTTCSVDLLLPNCSFRKLRLWQSYYFRGVEGSSLLLNFNFETFAGELLRRKDEEIARLKAALLQQTRGGDKEEEKAEEGGTEGEKEKEKGKEEKKKRESSWLTYKIFMQDRMLEEAKKQERKTEELQNKVEEKKELQMDKKKEAEDKRKERVEDEEQEEDSSSLGETTTDFTTEEQTEESAFSSDSSSSSPEEESDDDKTDESEKEEEEEEEEEQGEVKEILTSSWKSYKVNKQQQPQRPETQRLMSPRGEQQQQQQPKAKEKEKEKPKEKEKGGKKKEPDESEAEEGRKLQREETAATKQPAGAVRKWFFLGKKQQT